jgi:hypothetical protein
MKVAVSVSVAALVAALRSIQHRVAEDVETGAVMGSRDPRVATTGKEQSDDRRSP